MLKDKQIEIRNELFSKQWEYNTPAVAEIIILLDMIRVIYNKSKYIIRGTIILVTDNAKVQRLITRDLQTSNDYVQEAAAEATEIQALIKKAMIMIEICLIPRKPKIRAPFYEDPAPYLIIRYDAEVKRVRHQTY